MLSVLTWTNRGDNGGSDSDDFEATYGAATAPIARAIVDRALDDWGQVIANFNYAGGGNEYLLDISAADLGGGGRGVTTSTSTDGDGRPTDADIQMDDDGGGAGWFFDTTPSDDFEFNSLLNAFTSNGSNALGGNDFYRTIVHEIGHAMGIANGGSLAIQNFLSDSGIDDPYDMSEDLLLFQGATISATLTTNGGGHIFEGHASVTTLPSSPFDLMNAGRTVGFPPPTRELITDTDALILRDAYGYDIVLPSTINSFYANFDSTTGALTVNGAPGTSDDHIVIDMGQSIRVQVNGTVETFDSLLVTSINVLAGDGNDFVKIDGAVGIPATIDGGDGDDRLEGGDVTIIGGMGNDTLVGTGGNDSLDGGAGNDSLIGLGGQDTLLGGTGNDTLEGGTGDDSLDGGDDDDRIIAGLGNNTVVPGNGNDYFDLSENVVGINFNAGDGNDTVIGTAFNDSIRGGSGNDLVIGGDGNDSLEGGLGTDQVEGGAGLDFFRSQGGDLLLGGDDQDTFLVSGLEVAAGPTTIEGGEGGDIVTYISDGAITVRLTPNTITTAGLPAVKLIGVETANIEDDEEGYSLTVLGTENEDTIRYTPTGADSGSFQRDTALTVFNFLGISGAFTIDGDQPALGDAESDQVVIRGTDNHDVIRVSVPGRYAEVENAAGTTLKRVNLANGTEVLTVQGRLGNDTVVVQPGAGIETSVDGLPTNLLVYVDGGPPGASDALVIASDAQDATPLGSNLFVVVNRGRNPNEGVVRVFADQPGEGNEPIQFADIIYTDTEIVSPLFGLGINSPNLLILGPDNYEPNEFINTPAYLGGGSVLNVSNLAIFPNADEHRFVAADRDWYRVVAEHTGTMDFQVYFTQFNEFLPGNGDLNIEVVDEAGNTITGFGVNDFTANDERRRIPVVAGETYFLRVFGAEDTTVNGYQVTITNTPAPVPYDLEIDDGTVLPPPSNPPIGSDTGRSNVDNETFDNTPRIFLRLDDDLLLNDANGGATGGSLPPDAQIIEIPFRGSAAAADEPGFRIGIFDETDTHNPVFMGFADSVGNGLYTFNFTSPLVDGSHFITAKVQIVDPSVDHDAEFGPASASLELIIDTVDPALTLDLHDDSDTGIIDQPALNQDKLTSDTTPTFYGIAEADTIIRVYVMTPGGPVQIAQTTAIPLDGHPVPEDPGPQFEGVVMGFWQATSVVDLNDPALGLGIDELRQIFATAEDRAGNVTGMPHHVEAEPKVVPDLDIFLDTRGPRVDNVSVTSDPGFDLFGLKPDGTAKPTPLVYSLDVTFLDEPNRTNNPGMYPDFLYAAVNKILAETPGNYHLIGDATGTVHIVSAMLSDATVAGGKGMSTVTLTFDKPLADDRYTLTVNDAIRDDAGNALDGESQASAPFGGGGIAFPSGDGQPGGNFVARFTVDSRPEIGVYSSGSAAIDINGNLFFDPTNPDAVNRDIVFNLGFATDILFAGNFDNGGVADGFDKLAAYGFVNGQWRWLIDTTNDGIPDLNLVNPLAIDALPFAGNFNNAAAGDEVGLFDGTTWYLDTNANNVIDAGDLRFSGDLRGYPIAGDFDGDGLEDLGTWSNNQFHFDLAIDGLDGNADVTPISFGFTGVLERPVAADMDQDGIDDIGLWVPGRSQSLPGIASEWYFLFSDDLTGAKRVPGTVNTLNHPFTPVPFAADVFSQFGDQFALPIVGNFDPPVGDSPVLNGWIQNLYNDVLGRDAGYEEWDYWAGAMVDGLNPSDVANAFIGSAERRGGIINQLYNDYLFRDADAAGLQFWLGVWGAHGGPEYVQAGIISSAEYYQTAGGTDAAWVQALYNNILGRSSIGQDEIDYWVGVLKHDSRHDVVLGFVTSDEYRLGIINGWYQMYLGRDIDADGAQYWVQMMRDGLSQEAIQIGILSSLEYRSK